MKEICDKVNYTSIEIAIPSSGPSFEVEIVKHPDSPPVVMCDGQGINCPFQHNFKSAKVCVLSIPTANSDVLICGKPHMFEDDEDDRV